MSDALLHTLTQSLEPHAATLTRQPQSTIRPEAQGDATRRLAAVVELLRGDTQPFDLEEELGRGGMGVVRLATQRALGRKVAVKTLRSDKNAGPEALRLLQEAWVTGTVEHPNVVPIHDVDIQADGRPLVAFKRIEGGPWSGLLANPAEVRRRFGVEDALEWHLRTLMQVCTAIHFAHSRGILHRDLKPDNVMIGGYGEVYVVDWGIAVSLRDDGAGRLPLAADVQDLAGTPAYMAPEMIAGDGRALGPRTDVYLLGGLLHAILTGRPPHQGDSPLALALDALRTDYAFPPGTPPELAALCRRALSPEIDDRFETAEVMRQALQAFLDHRHSERLAAGATARLGELRRWIDSERAGADSSGAASASEGARAASVGSPETGPRGPHHPGRASEGVRPASVVDRTLEIYRLFGECRFGFRQALESWPGNVAAAEGLVQATRALVERELTAGHPAAASALLAELESPPPDLVARVEAAQREAEREQRRVEEAKRLVQRFDTRVGRRTRIIFAMVLAGMWIALPVARLVLGGRAEYRTMLWSPIVYLCGVTLVAWFGRRTLLAHPFNRRVLATVGLGIVAQWCLYLVGEHLGLSPEIALRHGQFLGFVATGVLAITLVPMLAPAPVIYLACYLLSAFYPQWLDPLVIVGNSSLAVTAWIIWRRRATAPEAPVAPGASK